MNLATAQNLTIDETIRALNADWCHPLPENVRSALVSRLIESSEELTEAKRQIETLKMSLKLVCSELEQAKVRLEQIREVLA